MRFYIFIFCLLTTPVVAGDADYYLRLAFEKNARLAVESRLADAAQNDASKESVFSANPEMSLGLMNVPANSFPALNRDTMSGVSFGISQKLALPWEAHYRKEASTWRAKNAQLSALLQKASLRYEVREKFNAVLFFTQRMKNLENAKKLIVATLRILSVPRKDARNTAGQILEARASLASAENDILENAYELEKAWLELSVLCGTTLEKNIADTTLLEWDNLSSLKISDTKDSKSTLLYKKVEQELRREQALVSLSKATLFPEVTLSASYLLRQKIPGSTMTDDMVSVAASMPIPLFYSAKNKYEIAAQKNRVEAAEQNLLEAERQISAQIKTEFARFNTLVKAAQNSTKAILPAHSSAHHSHLTNLSLSGSSAAEALIAYRMYLNADEEHLKQVRDAHSALHRLEYLAATGEEQ